MEGRPEDPRDADTVHGVAERKDRIFEHLLRQSTVQTFEGSVRYVGAVRQARLRTAVVSSSKHCQEVLASARLTDLFDAVVDGVVAERGHLAGKPAPDTYLAAARVLNEAPARAAVFEKTRWPASRRVALEVSVAWWASTASVKQTSFVGMAPTSS